MARTQKQIYDSLTNGINNEPELAELLPNQDNWSKLFTEYNFKVLASTVVGRLSSSKVSISRLILFIVSYGIWVVESLLDEHVYNVNKTIEEREIGTLPWWVWIAKQFQYGYELTLINNKYQYEDIQSDKAIASKIITQSASIDADTNVVLKVATGEIGALVPLDGNQLTAFTQFIKQVKPSGIICDIFNFAADDIKVSLQLTYDRLVLNSSGELLKDSVISELVAGNETAKIALQTYISSLGFNSYLYIDELVDALQGAEGIKHVHVVDVLCRYDANAYVSIMDDGNYNARAGYLALNVNDSTFTYV